MSPDGLKAHTFRRVQARSDLLSLGAEGSKRRVICARFVIERNRELEHDLVKMTRIVLAARLERLEPPCQGFAIENRSEILRFDFVAARCPVQRRVYQG